METNPWLKPIYNKNIISSEIFINTKLFKYFKKKAPIPNFNENKSKYCMHDILLALQRIILYNQFFDPENPYIIFFDQELYEIFEIKVFHVKILIHLINVQLVKSVIDLLQKASLPINRPIPKISFVNIMIYEQITEPFFDIIWGSNESFGLLAQKKYKKLDVNARYIVDLPLLKFLRTIDNVNNHQVVFFYKDICNLILNYIKKNKLCNREFFGIILIETDPIRSIFGNAKALHFIQFSSFLNFHLTPFIEHLETINTSSEFDNQIINIIQNPNGEYDTDESNYSYQNYETERCHDESDESSDSSEIILNETIYDNEYEIDSRSFESENINESSGDTDLKENIKIENINFLDYLTEFADSESEINTDKNNLFESKINKYKCIKCEKCIPHPFKYCSECWLYNSKNIPKRSNPRKRKKNFKINVVPSKKIYLIDENIQLNISKNQINCSICCDKKVDSSFIHGQTEHHICCYYCSKIIFKKYKRCPVCRKLIEKIVKTFKD